ncbi:hypothetical protein RRG08_018821 [Elysia crispata]|uniref:Uncharacterized protein n=1 Tax=Elysia crispata TaxID=231223 RepID=A0AAE0ZSL6_9GAST|nr:hypothetical protein RRG08_018821 [Elysia crispata]
MPSVILSTSDVPSAILSTSDISSFIPSTSDMPSVIPCQPSHSGKVSAALRPPPSYTSPPEKSLAKSCPITKLILDRPRKVLKPLGERPNP